MKGPLKGTPNMFELTGEASTEGFDGLELKMMKIYMDLNL